MQTRKTQGRIQNLKEKLETLKAFLSKGVNRSSSIYKVRNEVINNISYQRNKEAETSFQRWMNCMEAVPTVMPPTRGEVLSLHIAASPNEIGAMLFAERRRMALLDVEQSYTASEKLILALVHATRRLRRYFKDHPIRVLADKPFERAFLNPDGTRRVVKWAKELEEYDIEYEKNDPFEEQSNEPAETYESSMSSNKRIFQEEKHHIGDSQTCSVPHNQKKEERLVSGTEQQALTN
ncbi:reverse transcriptase domain-containing protein [Artemisia annua]|uniref:Reverse transcriptase domain-containing protein n=1 Tax=Artemisia annua TaxID=35608 RepID=A0A2U1K9D7_ARTAN|nr:reverse transcriptase domain-containing protein [Artemisia annua]